jgi:cytochrome P450
MQSRKLPSIADPAPETQNFLDWMVTNREQFGDIYQSSLYGRLFYVVSHPDYADHVLRKNWRNYKKGLAIKQVALLLGTGLMVSEGELWKRQRRMIQPAFHQDVVASMREVIVGANTALLAKWELAARRAKRANVTYDISLMTLEIVLKTLFGNDYEQVAPDFEILADVTSRNVQFARAFRELRNRILEIVTARRRHDSDTSDLLGLLMSVRDKDSGKPMSDNLLLDETVTLIVAGHETTAGTLNLIWYSLSKNPNVENKLYTDLCGSQNSFNYATAVINETLRMYPAGWLLTRKALQDDQIGDYFIPAGTEVYISPYIIQRHPDFWERPDQFDPDRFVVDRLETPPVLPMIPFSSGPRNCIGEGLARLQMQVHLSLLAGRLRLEHTDDRPLELDLGVNLRAKGYFLMTPRLR